LIQNPPLTVQRAGLVVNPRLATHMPLLSEQNAGQHVLPNTEYRIPITATVHRHRSLFSVLG